MSFKAPFNLHQWIEDNRDLLKPPVGNKNLYVEAGDFIVMVVGGPNARKDHYNETEELFYQIEGILSLKFNTREKRLKFQLKREKCFFAGQNPTLSH